MRPLQYQKALVALCVAAWVAAGSGSTARAQEAVLVHAESGGFITLEGETLVRVSGIQGTVAVRTGKDGELRYEVRTLDNRRVCVWSTIQIGGVDKRRASTRPSAHLAVRQERQSSCRRTSRSYNRSYCVRCRDIGKWAADS